MARSEARLKFDMWLDGLSQLGPHAKLLYVVVLTEPTLNHAGIGAVRTSRWARCAGLTEEEMTKALAELTSGNFVLVDEDTEEVFVRTLIRNDGVADQPYVLKGALRAALVTSSKTLRVALASELRKLPPRRPDGTSKSGKTVTYPDPHAIADVLDPQPSTNTRKSVETLSEGSRNPAQNPSESPHGGGGGGGVVTSVGGSVAKAAQKRGTRIPENFTPTPEMVQWARDRVPSVDGRRETEKFVNWFVSAPGSKGVKLDWVRTWKNWMLDAEERSPQNRGLRVVNGSTRMGSTHQDPTSGVFIER